MVLVAKEKNQGKRLNPHEESGVLSLVAPAGGAAEETERLSRGDIGERNDVFVSFIWFERDQCAIRIVIIFQVYEL